MRHLGLERADHSKASRAATDKLKTTPYTLDNNRRVASSRIAELAVLVALSVFEISNICKNWSFVARHH